MKWPNFEYEPKRLKKFVEDIEKRNENSKIIEQDKSIRLDAEKGLREKKE